MQGHAEIFIIIGETFIGIYVDMVSLYLGRKLLYYDSDNISSVWQDVIPQPSRFIDDLGILFVLFTEIPFTN